MARFFAASIIVAVLACGCAALPSYGLKVSAPHKDVLHLVIYLKERVSSDVYQQIALKEVTRIRAQRRVGLPLYEISFEFQKSGPEEERLARVVVRFGFEEGPGPAEVARATMPRFETTLY